MKLEQIRALAAEAALTGNDLTIASKGADDDNDLDDEGEGDEGPRETPQTRWRRAAEARKFAEAELKKLIASHAAAFAGIDVQVQARPKSSKPSALQDVIDAILTREGSQKTQTAIKAQVRLEHPQKAIPSDWSKPLPAWARKRLGDRLRGLGAPFDRIRLPLKPTLANLHQQARRMVLADMDIAQVAKTTITLTDDTLMIGDVKFSITTNRSKGREYRRAQVSVDRLREALGRKSGPH